MMRRIFNISLVTIAICAPATVATTYGGLFTTTPYILELDFVEAVELHEEVCTSPLDGSKMPLWDFIKGITGMTADSYLLQHGDDDDDVLFMVADTPDYIEVVEGDPVRRELIRDFTSGGDIYDYVYHAMIAAYQLQILTTQNLIREIEERGTRRLKRNKTRKDIIKGSTGDRNKHGDDDDVRRRLGSSNNRKLKKKGKKEEDDDEPTFEDIIAMGLKREILTHCDVTGLDKVLFDAVSDDA